MKKTRMDKGITLVALIITIVVLLILAAVAIGTVQNSDIIGYAGNASNTYTIEQGKENEAIKDAEKLLNQYANISKNTLESKGYYDGLTYVNKALKKSKEIMANKINAILKEELK